MITLKFKHAASKSCSAHDFPNIFLIMLLVLLHGAAARAAGEFASVWTSAQTDNTADVAWGDFDNDGDLDFAAANYGQVNRVFRNDGAGVFTLVWSSLDTGPTQSVEWGDSDKDGDLDMLVANWNNQNRVYRNDGGGAFTLVWSSPELDKTYHAAWGDFDNDGDLDFAAANDGQANRVYRNDGNNQFTLIWSSTETDNSRAAAWADYDNDGDPDILFGNYGVTRVYRNDGGGDFSVAWYAPQVDSTLGAAWGDYDGDGDPDIALANAGGKANRVYRNTGAGSFALAWTSPQMDNTQSVAWGDFDADGDLDLLAGNYTATPDRIYQNNAGSFTLFWSSTETAETYGAVFGDYDADGDLDILTASYAQANLIFQNTLNPANAAPAAPALINELDAEPGWVTLQWTAPTDDHTPSALLGYQLRIGTTTGGSQIMSAALGAYPGNAGNALSKTVYLPLGTYFWSVAAIDTSFQVSSFAAEDSFTLTAQPFQSAALSAQADDSTAAALADYDGDGDHDILVGNNGQANRVYRNDGGSLTLAWSSAESDSTRAVAWADCDGDGDLDFAAGNNAQANRVYLNSGGSWSAAWSSAETDNTYAVAWGDFDRDGDMDLFAGNDGQANRVYRNDGAGVFTLVWSSAETDNTRAAGVADYDRDGDPDILFGNYGQANRVYRNDGAGVFTLVWSSGETDNTTSVAWGYGDSDNDLDIAVGNDGQSNRLYRNDGGGAFALVKTFAATDATTGAQWGDADGDGDVELLFANTGEPDAVYANDGGNTFSSLWTSPESNAVQAAAFFDYDGDGDLDYYAAANGANRVYQNKMNPLNSAPAAPAITVEPDGDPGPFTLQWTASTDDHTSIFHTGYQVRIGTLSGKSDVVSGALVSYPGNAEATVSFHITLNTGAYFWSVRAVDNTGYAVSGWSAEDMFLVSGPDTNAPLFDGLQTAAGCGGGCVNLSWTAANDLQNSTPVTYAIYMATTSGAQNFAAPVTTTTSTSAQVSALTNDTTYFFVVRARDSAGNEDTNTVEVAAAPSSLPAFTKYANNPVMSGDGTGFDALAVMDPHVYYDGSVFRMWYTGRNAGGSDRMGYAVSKDGVNWARVQGPATNGALLDLNSDASAFDSSAVGSGFVMANPPTSSYKYYMWYTGVRNDNPNSWRIGLARSNDGITWERVPGPAEGGAVIGWTADSFDEYSAYGPWVVYEGGMYKMWYTGAEVNTTNFTYEYRVGYATSADGITWTKYSGPQASNSLMTMGAAGAFDEQRATHPNIYMENNLYKMVYSGFDGAKYRMGYAASPDGLAWTKYPGSATKGSIIDNGATYDSTIAGLSSLQVINGSLHLWYKAYTGTASEYYIMYANNAGISPPQLTAITIATADNTFVAPGAALSFTATCQYSAANTYCNGATSCDCTSTVAWSSSNTAAATIGQLTGQATAVALGNPAITASCAGVTSNAITINVFTYPTVAIILPVEGAQLSNSTTITGTVQDAALSSWTLYYSPGAAQTKLKMIASGTTQVASGTLATWDTSNLRGNYTLHLVAQNTGGYTATDTVNVFVLNKATISGTAPAFEWVLLSVPVEPDNPAPTAMFASTHQEYKIYRWDPAAQSQNYLFQYTYPDTLSAGQGFWIKSYYNDLPYSYTGALIDTTTDYSIDLKAGWNQFGAPFNRDYPWGDVLVSYQGVQYPMATAVSMELINATIYGYDNASNSWVMGDMSSSLTPGTGYDVRAYADVSLVFGPGAGLTGGVARRVRNTADYMVKISARGAESADTDNYFGSADKAAPGFDPMDSEEPPRSPHEKYTALYFPQDQWSVRAGRYAADVRAPAREQGNTQNWDLVVETTETGQTMTLSWNAAALPSLRFSFTLIDMQTGARIDMATQGSYTYTAAGDTVSQSRFRIQVVTLATQTVTRTHTLGPGWHLISAPLDPVVTGAFEQLGDDLPLLQVFQYHDRAFYTGADADIQAGLGYWVHVDASAQIDITGLALPNGSAVRVPLFQGWNLIGNPFDTNLPWADNIALDCGGQAMPLSQAVQEGRTDGALYQYADGQYAKLGGGAALQPWSGYLVRARGGCDLILAQ